MTKHTPTPEQQAIIDAARDTSDNLIIEALAGAAKTSTLVMIAEALPSVSILTLAFNKKIADEMRERLPSNCDSLTLNSLGHRAWASFLGRRIILDAGKSYSIIKACIEVEKVKKVQDELYSRMSDLIRALDFAKSYGWVPDGMFPNAKSLATNDQFFAALEEEPTEREIDLLIEAMKTSISMALKGTINFDDQIYMPTLFPCTFPQYPLVLIDESQDLSNINHAMLAKIARKRLIAVGDPNQAIYGFRGAHQDSMDLLQQKFSMRKLVLSVSFRCPIAVVSEARWRAPHMQYPTWAKPGLVTAFTKWTVNDLPDDAVILCRNNAPIFSMAIRLFTNDRYAQIVGNDIGKSLLNTMKKLGRSEMPAAEAHAAIDLFIEQKLRRSRDAAKVHDLAACMRVFIEKADTLGESIAYAERIMQQHGTIKMMTGHKSKGLEYDNVFILDRHLLRLDKSDQDGNLLYVMQTRSKSTLTYIETETFAEVQNGKA